jgi:hypothetical protein
MRILLRTSLVAVASVAFLSTPAAAEADKVIPLRGETQQDVALLGDGVVGKALPAPTLTDPAAYLNLGGGVWEFKIVSGKDKGKTQKESYKKEAENRWQRRIGDEYLEHLTIGGEDGTSKVAETALSFGYRATFPPGIHEAKSLEPGQSIEIDSKLAVSEEKTPDEVKYTGTMKATFTYEGAYEVTVPAGTFETILVRVDAKIHVGPANVEDTQYIFFAKGVGKVAEVEALRIAAILVYHSHSKTAKVLTSYPKR